jgi:hypothetical protein
MSLTKLSLTGNNFIIPGQGEFGVSDNSAGDGKNDNLFYSVGSTLLSCQIAKGRSYQLHKERKD